MTTRTNPPNLRDLLDIGAANQLPDAFRTLVLGDLIAKLVLATAADQTALNPNASAQLITLAAVPTNVLHVQSVAGAGFLGRLVLKIGVAGKVDPVPGEVVWSGPGSAVLRFNAADAYTSVSVWYTDATDKISATERFLGQVD